MLVSISRLVELGVAHLPPGLLGGPAERRLAAIPDRLPPAFGAAAFECRLHPGGGPVDFTCGIHRGRGQGELRRHWAQEGWHETGAGSWDGCARLLRQWSNVRSRLHDQLDEVWLEFDLEGEGEPEPFVYVTPIGHEQHLGARDADQVMSLAGECLDLLEGRPSGETLQTMERCVHALPGEGRFLQFAPLMHRRADTLRLVVVMPSHDVGGYLERIGWPGDVDEACALFVGAGAGAWVSPLQLDVADGVLPPISREFCDHTTALEDARWSVLMDLLEQRSACDPARRPWLEAWPTGSQGVPFRRIEPVQLRRLLQVKLLHVPGAAPRAKAYLGFQPQAALFAP